MADQGGMGWGQMAGMGALGAGMGALSGLGGGWSGKSGKMKQAQRFTDPQQSALNMLLSQGMQNMNPMANEQRARSMFQQETIPSLAERFTSMGGGQRSSAFQGALGRAGSDLESQLAGLRSQLGMQQTQMGLTPQFENYYQAAQPGMLQGGMEGIMKLLPLLGMFI
jgi:hypothetical protein